MYLESFTRQRPARTPDPQNPDRSIDDWASPQIQSLQGYFEVNSSSEQVEAARKQVVTVRTLVVMNPDADVKRGDRIVQDDKTWTVQAFPDAPRNPFTNWRPGLWVRLIEGTG